jgi:hypothetical protein
VAEHVADFEWVRGRLELRRAVAVFHHGMHGNPGLPS